MEVLGIIGARAGSRGLPGKNVRSLGGRPLIAHAIETARRSGRITRVVFSTDSEEYAQIARDHGAEAPFLRPAEHATDTAIELGYIRHAVLWLEEQQGYRPDIVARLCPTAPLIRVEDVDRCIDLLLNDPSADSAIIMTEAREHPRKAVKYGPDGQHVVSYISERGVDVAPSNRQSYAAAYNRQSLPVVSRRDTIIKLQSQTGDCVLGVVVPQATAVDIDTESDFQMVEELLARRASDAR